jgi:L-asparaginase
MPATSFAPARRTFATSPARVARHAAEGEGDGGCGGCMAVDCATVSRIAAYARGMRHVTLITTGGTIEKTYDEMTGTLENRRSVVRRMLARLRLVDAHVSVIELMSKDSLNMTEADRGRVVEAVRAGGGAGPRREGAAQDGIVILHGTDTLALTGERIMGDIPNPAVPIVLTGAMRPYEMTRSDALQNLTEAIFAAGVLGPGVYCAAHGRVLSFPGVKKDPDLGTFVKP